MRPQTLALALMVALFAGSAFAAVPVNDGAILDQRNAKAELTLLNRNSNGAFDIFTVEIAPEHIYQRPKTAIQILMSIWRQNLSEG